jgi:hypothetical protein
MIKLPAILVGFSSHADGGAGIRFTTNELMGEDYVNLAGHKGKFGWLIFNENEVQDEDIPKMEAEETKTPSQRLRAVLFVLWKQEGSKGNFEDYYRSRMEKLIDVLKNKLD